MSRRLVVLALLLAGGVVVCWPQPGNALAPGAPGAAPEVRAAPPVASRERVEVTTTRPLHVRGRLVAAESQIPLTDARVAMQRPGRTEQEVAAGIVVGRDGRFDLEVPEAQGALVARARGRLTKQAEVYRPYANDVLDLKDIALDPGAHASGHVWRASDRSPVAGARLWWNGDHVGTSDDSGAFSLWDGLEWNALDDEPGRLLAESQDGLGWVLPILRQGTEAAELDILVVPGGRLSVLVREPDGAPVADAEVRMSLGGWGPLNSESPLAAQLVVHTGARGTARFDRLPAGAGTLTTTLSDRRQGAASTDLVIAPDGDTRIEIVLPVAGFLHARVCSAGSHAGLADSVLLVDDLPRDGEKGTFKVPLAHAAGTKLRLVAAAPGYAGREQEVAVPATGDLAVEFLLESLGPAGPISGVVVDDLGSPVMGTDVCLGSVGRDRTELREMAFDGSFRFSDVPGGSWWLWISRVRPYGAPWDQPAPQLVRPGETGLRLVLRKSDGPARIVVQLRTEDGAAVPEVSASQLLCESVDGATTRSGSSAQDGQIHVDGVGPGWWRLRLELDSSHVILRTVEVRADDKEVVVPIALRPPGTLTGEIEFDGIEIVPSLIALRLDPQTGEQIMTDGFYRAAPTKSRPQYSRQVFLVRPALSRRFRATGVVSGERLTLLATTPDQPWLVGGTAAVVVPPNGEAHVTVRLVPGARIRVRSREPFATGQRVRLLGMDNSFDWLDWIRPEGPHELVVACPPGTWHLLVDAQSPQVRSLRVDVTTRSGETTEILWPER